MREKKNKDKARQHSMFTVSIPAFLLSVGMGLFNVIMGIATLSGWYFAIAGHFFAFAALRFIIVFYKFFVPNKTEDKEVNLYVIIGILLILLTLSLSLTIFIIMKSGRPKVLGTIPAITSALHSTIKVWGAIRKLKKANKKNNYLKRTIRNINMAETIVSLIVLAATMITTFGDGKLESPLFLASAAVLCALILVLGVRMIGGGLSKKIALKKSRNYLPEQE